MGLCRGQLLLFSLVALLSGLPAAAQTPSAGSEKTLETFPLGAGSSRGSFRSVIRPIVDVSLSARAAGIVEIIHASEGSQIKAGEPIFSLDSNQEKAELSQAEAATRGAKAELDRASAEFERIQRLRIDNIYSDKQLLDAKAQAELAQSRYDQSLAATELARVRLANRAVTSPIDGIFLKTNKLVGEAVERYETVARVVDVSSLELVVFCDARNFNLFKPSQRVDVRVLKSSEDQPVITGRIYHIDPIIDPSSGTFRVKVRIDPSSNAVPGLPAILIAPEA